MWFSIISFFSNYKKLFLALIAAFFIFCVGFYILNYESTKDKLQDTNNALQGQVLQLNKQIASCNATTENFQNQAKLELASAVEHQKKQDELKLKRYNQIEKNEYISSHATCEETIQKLKQFALSHKTS